MSTPMDTDHCLLCGRAYARTSSRPRWALTGGTIVGTAHQSCIAGHSDRRRYRYGDPVQPIERFALLLSSTDAPAYWIQDTVPIEEVAQGRGDYDGTLRLYAGDRDQDGHCCWQAEMLDTEAAIVLTVRRQDAATIVARVLAALNGGDQ